MVNRPSRGTTLLETLVVCFLFSLLTTVILGFYMFANRASQNHEQLSENYRKMLTVLDRIETLLQGSKVLACDGHQVLFTQLDPKQPVLKGGWPNYSPQAIDIVMKTDAKTSARSLNMIFNGKEELLTNLPTETLAFSWDQTGNTLRISLQGKFEPKEGIGIPRTYSFTRSVLLDQF